MKRLAAALLAVSIAALSGCSKYTDQRVLAPTDGSPYFHLDSLPEIGKYDPKEPERYYEEYQNELKPSDSYGLLLPYIGRSVDYSMVDMPESSEKFRNDSYGLCTADGKIVVDPVYSYVNVTKSDDGFEYYSLTKETGLPNGMTEEEFYKTGLPFSTTAIAPIDGSWVISVGESEAGSWVTGASDGVIIVCSGHDEKGVSSYDFYDYNGKKTATASGYSYIDPFSQGLAKATTYSYVDGEKDYGSDNQTVCYLNKEAKVVLSGYLDGSVFNDEKTAFVKDGATGLYGLIDMTGKYVLAPEYTSISYCNYGSGWYQATKNGESFVLDPTGKTVGKLVTQNYASVYGDKAENMVYSFYDSEGDQEYWYRLSDGKEFVCKEFGKSPNTYGLDGNVFMYKDEAGMCCVFGLDGETIAKLPDINWVISCDLDRGLLMYVRGGHGSTVDEQGDIDEDSAVVMYDIKEQKEIKTIEDGDYANIPDKDGKYCIVNSFLDTGMFGGKTLFTLFDLDKREAVFEDCKSLYGFEVDGKEYYNAVYGDKLLLLDEELANILTLRNTITD